MQSDSKEWKDDFKGLGSMKKLVDQHNEMMKHLNNIEVLMPPHYSGAVPTLTFENDELIFDFQDALVFTLNNVRWRLSGGPGFVYYNVEVVQGQLVITVRVASCPT